MFDKVELNKILFSLAEIQDDPEIRRLLRENPMGGGVSVSMRQEPDYFIESDGMKGSHHTIVARSDEKLVAVGSCAIRPRFVNGSSREVGYLRTLRLDGSMAGRFDILKRGYHYLREKWKEWQKPPLFTSIAAENTRAIQFLERGLPGMPRYRFLSEYVTRMIPVRRTECEENGQADLEEIAEFLNRKNAASSLAPVWTVEELRGLSRLNLHPTDFAVLREGDRIVACGAVWDQRAFKQTVIHRYPFPLSVQRPLFNCVSPLFGQPPMPDPGEVCPFAFVSHLAADESNISALLHQMMPIAQSKGIRFLCAGFASGSLLLKKLRTFAHSYRSRLYQVDWPDIPAMTIESGLAPEIALL